MESTPRYDSSHPLFSTILTLYILFLLYSPPILLRTLLSPILFITGALLLTLLRFGATKPPSSQPGSDNGDNTPSAVSHPIPTLPPTPNKCFEESFVEWDVKAPLEVIYEDYEGADPAIGDDPDPEHKLETRFFGIERYPSLSLCYPETDSDSGSSSDEEFTVVGDWISKEDFRFRWADQDPDRDGLIEIALDFGRGDGKDENLEFHAEEENLIEIDISRARNNDIIGEKGFAAKVTCS